MAKRLRKSVVFDRDQVKLVDKTPDLDCEVKIDRKVMTILRYLANSMTNMVDWEST